MPIYEGGDIDAITTDNIEAVMPSPDGGTFITFRVHGGDGTRTYHFAPSIKEVLDGVEGLAEMFPELAVL